MQTVVEHFARDVPALIIGWPNKEVLDSFGNEMKTFLIKAQWGCKLHILPFLNLQTACHFAGFSSPKKCKMHVLLGNRQILLSGTMAAKDHPDVDHKPLPVMFMPGRSFLKMLNCPKLRVFPQSFAANRNLEP